jgi:hypothetical protein
MGRPVQLRRRSAGLRCRLTGVARQVGLTPAERLCSRSGPSDRKVPQDPGFVKAARRLAARTAPEWLSLVKPTIG